MDTSTIVVVGGGHAGVQFCDALRKHGVTAKIHLICEEKCEPYHRPPLSKGFLASHSEVQRPQKVAQWYAQHDIVLHLGIAAREVDRINRQVILEAGERINFDWLVLATGSRPRTLQNIDPRLENVFTVRNVGDAVRLRERLLDKKTGTLTILGGGFVGLEVAVAARASGWAVNLIESAPRLLRRSTSPVLAQAVLSHLQKIGCQFEFGAGFSKAIVADGRLQSLCMGDADVVIDSLVLSVGATPETSLAQSAGLAIDNGIAVDGNLVTSDPRILAIGDCAAFVLNGDRVRIESINNASEQANVAASTVAGDAILYRPVPTFWSDFGSMKIQMTGIWREGLNSRLRLGAADGAFSLFHYDDTQLVCVESVNAPTEHAVARTLLSRGLSPSIDQVGSVTTDLRSLTLHPISTDQK